MKNLGGGFALAAVVMTDSIAEGAERNGLRFLTSHVNEPFVTDRSTLEPAPDAAAAVWRSCRDRGLLVQVVSENVWRIAPPLTVSDDEIDRALSIVHESLAEFESR